MDQCPELSSPTSEAQARRQAAAPRPCQPYGCLVKSPQTPMMHRMLNAVEPTMVPTPTSPLVMKTPMTDVNSSGAELPAAMNMAPATSSLRCRRSFLKPQSGVLFLFLVLFCHFGLTFVERKILYWFKPTESL